MSTALGYDGTPCLSVMSNGTVGCLIPKCCLHTDCCWSADVGRAFTGQGHVVVVAYGYNQLGWSLCEMGCQYLVAASDQWCNLVEGNLKFRYGTAL